MNPPAGARAALRDLLLAHAVRTGEFTLSAGGTSSWYLDARLVTFRGECVPVVGRAVAETLDAAGVSGFEAVGGMTLGADPVALAVATEARIRAFTVRKETKGHGAGGRFAGPLGPGDRVLVVDDTVTTGASLLGAVEALREYGCPIVAATCLVDRGGALGPTLDALGIPFHPVLGAPDLGFEYGS